MPTIALPLDQQGRPVVQVEVAVTAAYARALRQAGHPAPPVLVLQVLIDTGAGCTCIDPQARRKLHLRRFTTKPIYAPTSGAGAKVGRGRYKVNLLVRNPAGAAQQDLTRNAFTVAAIPLTHLGVAAVLGRDLLKRCRFVYDGQKGTFELPV